MPVRRCARFVVSACLVGLTSGCVAPSPTPLRLYNLNSGDIIRAEMAYSNSGNGPITATLPTGETCSGEYAIGAVSAPYPMPRPYSEPEWSDTNESYGSESDDDGEWAERYGFSEGAIVQPVGSATLVGNRGTLLEIVFYHFYYYHGPRGDGVARDSFGNFYRVYVGHMPESSKKSTK